MTAVLGDVKPLTTDLRLEGIAFELEIGDRLLDSSTSQVVISPKDVSELGKSLGLAFRHKLAVNPIGGCTRIELGKAPDRLGVAISTTRLDGIVGHTPADLTATVQAGMTIDSLQSALRLHGQFLAIDPPIPHKATVGGTLAVGTSGPLKWQYGSLRDVVIGMKVVQADGTVTKSGGQVVKNVSGYDMSRLHIGGLGTLGIIAEASFKLTPLPAKEATVLARFGTVGDCVEAALEIFKSEGVPLALTTFTPDAAGRSAVVSNGGAHFLAVRHGGRPRTLERQVHETRSACLRHDASTADVIDKVDSIGLWRNLADFGWDEDELPLICARSSVVPSRVAELVQSLEQIGPAVDVRPVIVAHPAHGIVQALWSLGDAGPPRDAVVRLVQQARGAASRWQGTMVIERCPSEVKSDVDVWGDPGESVAIMRRLKEQYDPGRILNPGRFAGGI